MRGIDLYDTVHRVVHGARERNTRIWGEPSKWTFSGEVSAYPIEHTYLILILFFSPFLRFRLLPFRGQEVNHR